MLRPYFFACTFPPGAHSPAMTDLKRSLRLVDGLAMVVGIMVGSGIFRTPGLVAAQLGRPWLTFVAWVLGGALAFLGALCFAELATRHPRAGGKYVYVREAFGPRAGFVVGWVESVGMYTAAIAAIGVAAAEFLVRLTGWDSGSIPWLGAALVALFTAVNLIGVASGRWVQNLVAADVASAIVGARAGALVAGLALLVVLASINGNVFVTPRVLFGLAREGLAPGALARVNRGGTPWVAMLLVGAVAIALAATGTFETLLGLAIAEVLVIDGLTVAALFPLRAREPRAPFSVPGYPVAPILFIGVYLVLFI